MSNITAYRCTKCGKISGSRIALCSQCGSDNLEELECEGRGSLVNFTTIYTPPQKYAHLGSYTIGVMRLENGVRVFGVIENPEKLSRGMDVKISNTDQSTGQFIFHVQDKVTQA